METRRDIFQGIADPTRRAIITLLSDQVLGAGEIAAYFPFSRQTISRHVQILVECDLVLQQNSGREMYYHLNGGKVKEVADWLIPIQINWNKKFAKIDQLISEIKAKNNSNER